MFGLEYLTLGVIEENNSQWFWAQLGPSLLNSQDGKIILGDIFGSWGTIKTKI